MLIEGLRTPTPAFVPSVPVAAATQARPDEGGQAPVKLPYVSPVLSYDNDAAMAVLLFRNSETGDVERQIPSEQVVREYRLRGPFSGTEDGRDGGTPQDAVGRPAAAAAAVFPGSTPAVAAVTAQGPADSAAAPVATGASGVSQGAAAGPVNIIA